MPQSTIPALDKATRWALKKGYLDLVRSLRGESEDENKYVHAISWAAKRGYLPLVKILLSLPQSIRNKWRREYGRNGETDALEWAARMGYTEIVKLLVKYGDPKNNNSYAYQRAVENGHKEVAGILAPLSDPEIVKKSKKTKESIRRVRSGKVLRESVTRFSLSRFREDSKNKTKEEFTKDLIYAVERGNTDFG